MSHYHACDSKCSAAIADVVPRSELDGATAELKQYRREIAYIRDQFLRGRDKAEVITVGQLLKAFQEGPGQTPRITSPSLSQGGEADA